MSDPYEEIVNGERVLRLPPRPRHEEILQRLNQRVAGAVASLVTTRQMAPRTKIDLSSQNSFRPDLALLTSAASVVVSVVMGGKAQRLAEGANMIAKVAADAGRAASSSSLRKSRDGASAGGVAVLLMRSGFPGGTKGAHCARSPDVVHGSA